MFLWDKAYRILQRMEGFEDVTVERHIASLYVSSLRRDILFKWAVKTLNFLNRITVLRVTVRDSLTMKIIILYNTEWIYNLFFSDSLLRISLFLRNFTSGRQKLRSVLKFLFPIGYLPLYYGLSSLSQAPTTNYWTCDGLNRQLHVGRSAYQRRWHRTIDSGRIDPEN